MAEKTSFMEWLYASVDWRVSSGAMKGKRFTLDAFPCQKDILLDESKNISIQKSAQMAASEQFTIARPFYFMDVHKINWGVLFPDQGAMRNFYRTRLRAGIAANRFVKARVTAENESNIDVFDRSLYLRYTTTEAAIATFDADGVTVDEMDLHNRETLFGARTSRTQGAMQRTWWYQISTPSYAKFGINQAFLDGDQMVWLVRCKACTFDNDLMSKIGEYDILDVPTFFHEFLSSDNFPDWRDLYIPCSKCGAKIDPVMPYDPVKRSFGGGRWVSRYPQRDERSRYLPIWHRLYEGGTPEVLRRVRQSLYMADTPELKKRWWNSTLGMVYVPREGKLHDEDLERVSTTGYGDRWARDLVYPRLFKIHGERWDWMGTDVRDGQYHVIGLKRLSEEKTLLCGVGWVEYSSQVRELWERMGNPFQITDALPDVNETRALVKSMGRRGARGKLGKNIQGTWTPVNEDGVVMISRPKVMEAVKAAIESMSWIVPVQAWRVGAGIFQSRGESRVEETLADHFKAPTIIRVFSDGSGNVEYDFPKDAMDGIDPHYFMAAAFAYVASRMHSAPSYAVTIPR